MPEVAPMPENLTKIFAEAENQKQSFLDEAGQFFPDGQNIAPPEPPPADPPPKKDVPEPPAKPPAKKGVFDEPPIDKSEVKIEDEIPREFPGTDKKRKVQWDALHSKREAAEKRAQELEAQIRDFEGKLTAANAAPKANPEAEKQLLDLQRERDQYSQLLEAVAAERHPKFQQQFQGRVASAIELAKQAVGPENAERITQLLQMPDTDYRNTQLDSIITDLGPMKAGKLNTAISQMDLISAERSQMASQGQKLYQQWTQEAQEKQRAAKAQVEAHNNQTFEQEMAQWKGVAVFTPKENDAAHNAEVSKNIELAKNIFMGQMDNAMLAKASMWAAYGQKAAAAMKTVTAENEALRTELASLKASKPGPPRGQPATESDKDDGSKTYGERMAQQALDQGFIRS